LAFIGALHAGRALAGAIAQLGERLLCKQEVVGSIPSGSTILAWSEGSSLQIIQIIDHPIERLSARPSKQSSATVVSPRGAMRVRDI
jgi:hypothetical protein